MPSNPGSGGDGLCFYPKGSPAGSATMAGTDEVLASLAGGNPSVNCLPLFDDGQRRSQDIRVLKRCTIRFIPLIDLSAWPFYPSESHFNLPHCSHLFGVRGDIE
ncbi:hypothetical protein K239x_32790 [Planctomycetes bacterium K23_9]|uniref:Uncharacterized protein n=1 Tax=Stieleria marina TaxID=1930275 RepID=A0A517NVX5_9BACT|nr:hypothetical protein K239x_32790 [Planctomycetes bacterium K23_9]